MQLSSFIELKATSMNSEKDLRNADAPVDINSVMGITAQEAANKIYNILWLGVKKGLEIKTNYLRNGFGGTTTRGSHCLVAVIAGRRDAAGCCDLTGHAFQVDKMNTSKDTQTNNVERYEEVLRAADRMDLSFLEETETDVLVEKLFDSMQCSPLGRLLKIISTLPEVRAEKVEHARREVELSDECLESKMDLALDRVLEELI
jgi:hypothetical protein